MELKAPPTWVTIAISGALIVALADLPYGYYQLLRILVTGYASYLCYLHAKSGLQYWPWALGLVAVIYNPFYVISMSKDFHGFVNLASACLLAYELHCHRSKSFAQASQPLNISPQPPSDADQQPRSSASYLAGAIIFGLLILIGCSSSFLVWLHFNEKISKTDRASISSPEVTPPSRDSANLVSGGVSLPAAPEGSSPTVPKALDAAADKADNPTERPTSVADWRGELGRCRLTVSTKLHISGTCWVRLDSDGSFQIMSLDDQVFAKLLREGANGNAFWNEGGGATHAQASLGNMMRKGGCWQNADAELCAWAL